MGTSFIVPDPSPADRSCCWDMEAAGAPCAACPTAPACSPGSPGLCHHGASHQGQGVWHGGVNVGKREKEEMEQAGESSRWRRMSIVEAECGWWGCQPFGLVTCALKGLCLPSRGLAGAAAGGPVRTWGRGCWVSGGHGIKPFCRGEGRLLSCRGVTS